MPSQLMSTGRYICIIAAEEAKVAVASSSLSSFFSFVFLCSGAGAALICLILGGFFAPEVGVVEGPEDLMPNGIFAKPVSLYSVRWASILVLYLSLHIHVRYMGYFLWGIKA